MMSMGTNLINVVELEDTLHGAKDLLPCNPHVIFHVGEDRWFHIEALVAYSLAT